MAFKAIVRLAAGIAAAAIIVGTAHAANLAGNGSFEKPVTPAGGFLIFPKGAQIGAWQVVGEDGEVGLIDKDYVAGSFTSPSRSGKQWLDLTPRATITPTAIGVEQTVRTTPARDYVLSFFVGNVRDQNGQFGTTSTVNVFVDGEQVMSATNRAGRGKTSVVWRKFSLTFTAARRNTRVAFINGDNDDLNGLDAVSLVPAP